MLGLLASATSPIALAFVLSCVWCAGRELDPYRDWRSLAAPGLAPLGFLGFMLWLWAHTGVLSAWRLTERQGWQSYPSLVYPVHIGDPLRVESRRARPRRDRSCSSARS